LRFTTVCPQSNVGPTAHRKSYVHGRTKSKSDATHNNQFAREPRYAVQSKEL